MAIHLIGRSLLLAATLVWGGCLVPSLSAGEAKSTPVLKESELKARMKSLIAEALKAGDVWTALQADAYASQKLGVRSAGILGAAEVIGDPLFAFPNRIASHHPRADQVVVTAGQRLYRLALDGRPLAVSQPLPFVPHASALSADGTFVAVAERQRTPTWALKVLVRNLATGAEVFSATFPLVAADFIHGDMQVAPDGSAVSIGVLNDDGEAGPRLMVLRASGKHVAVPAFFRPLATASDGTWGLAEPASNLEDGERHVALLHGGSVVTCRSAAVGPGVAALIEQGHRDQVQIVARDGTRSVLSLPRPLTSGGRVLSSGEWLLVASGWPQETEAPADELDLLGGSAPSAGEPFTTWFYRWSDVTGGALLTQPALTVRGVPGISTLTPTTVFVGGEAAVQVVDLAQATPEAKPLMTPAGRVRYVEPRHGRVILWLREGRYQVIDESGADLWHGVASNGVMVHDPWFASIHQDDGATTWVRLASDPAQRLGVPLALPASDYELELDRYHRRMVAARSRAEWIEFDPATGKASKPNGIRPLRPQVVGLGPGSAISPFTVQWARLVPRLAPAVAEDPASRWNPLDAWRAGGTLVVLDRHGQVHIAGRKRGSYQTLGSVDYPASFAQTAAGDLLVASDENVAKARLAAGPILATEGQGIGQPAQPLTEGPWRVKNLFYVPPRGGSLMWDATRCGFTPMRLRSPPPPATGMLVVTDSLVFDLDAAAGKQFGAIDKAGLRDADE